MLTIGWSAKEAVLKALGKGLALSPRDIEIVSMEKQNVQVQLTVLLPKNTSAWVGLHLFFWQQDGETEVLVHARFEAA